MSQGFETRGLVPNMDMALVSASHTMPVVTLFNLPLSTAFNYNLKKSLSSLEWVLSSGVPTVISVSGPLSLPYRDGAVDTASIRPLSSVSVGAYSLASHEIDRTFTRSIDNDEKQGKTFIVYVHQQQENPSSPKKHKMESDDVANDAFKVLSLLPKK
ncbi:hypothetical protein B0H13DRAFT_2353456 [Mycena leptocephala]|nr:hypothetical protein B0H13DRAFT_2353456 [Mycena leptocephala]